MALAEGRTPKQHVSRGMPVPYIALWEHEHEGMDEAVIRFWQQPGSPANSAVDVRLASVGGMSLMVIPDGYPFTERINGILWLRPKDLRGRGEPDFGQVHASRHRASVARRLCQVCGRRIGKGPITWVTHVPVTDERPVTEDAPVCDECYEVALRMCPHLRKRWRYVYRVDDYEYWGGRFRAKAIENGQASNFEEVGSFEAVRSDPRLAATLVAGQAVARFVDYELIDEWHANA